ncbi:hypothetical protein ABKN59_011660, partial [Abortiporus biennis]
MSRSEYRPLRVLNPCRQTSCREDTAGTRYRMTIVCVDIDSIVKPSQLYFDADRLPFNAFLDLVNLGISEVKW